MTRGFRAGMPVVRAGMLALVAISVFTWFAFTKDIPFTEGYRVQAVFESSNLLSTRSPVRIAGVDVGKVVEMERYRNTDMALVTMEIEDAGRPIKDDAQLKIRPRLFLEGNFYIEVKPGTPRGSELADGGMIPVTQTANPVQLDQILTALQSDERASLQDLLQGFGDTLDSEPTAADDATQDPLVRGLTGGEAFNETFQNSPQALRDSSVVLDDLRGRRPHDLSRTIDGFARAAEGLGRDERRLGSLVSDFNTTMAATASEAPALRETVRLLGPTAASARRGFSSLDRALPPTRAFAREILPGMREIPATIAAADPWLEQALPLLGEAELGGLLSELSPTGRELARLSDATLRFLPQIDRFNRCVNEVLIPTGNIEVRDGEFSAGVESYKELWYAMVGQAGEGQSLDGNGSFLRVNAATGATTIASGKTNYTGDPLFANAVSRPLRTAPFFPNELPPLRRDVPCHTNPVPDVNGVSATGPADGSRPRAAPPAIPADSPAQAALATPSLVPLREVKP